MSSFSFTSPSKLGCYEELSGSPIWDLFSIYETHQTNKGDK